MIGKYFLYRSAEVNGTKPKSLRTGRELPQRQQKSRAMIISLLGSESLTMGVFSDDFAAVDVREELCYHSRPKKTNLRGALSGHETNERKLCAAEKAAADPQAVQRGRFRAAALSVWFSVLFLLSFSWRVLGCGERSEPHLSKTSARHGAK